MNVNNWSRADLKSKAKAVLRVNYWIAFVVALILTIVSGYFGGSGNCSGGFEYRYELSSHDLQQFRSGDFAIFDAAGDGWRVFQRFFTDISPWLISAIMAASIMALIFALSVRILLFNQLEVGCRSFFKTAAEEPHKNMRHLGIAFKDGNYVPVLKTMFLRGLYTFLWTLLFIIPGIIKAYAYRMVPYILVDNPKMEAGEAIALSRKMMMGEKWKTFVLDLSFIGWYLLGLLALGIGVLFVNPYAFSTEAQLYLVLRKKAVDNNYCTPQQLNIQELA